MNYDKEGHASPSELDEESGGGGRAEYDRETADAGAIRRLGRAGPTSRGGEATRPNAAALARGVGHGIATRGVNGNRQGRRDGGGAAAEKGYRRGGRAPRPSRDHRDANRRKDREERGASPERGQGDRAGGS